MDFNREIEVAKAAAKAAGDYALINIAAESRAKQCDNSIVTDIDVNAQKMIIDALRAEFPSYGIIGEEPDDNSGQMLLNIPPSGDLDAWWIIDPIDGTRNFAFGLPYFAVSIGLFIDGYPAAGVIYYPDRKEMFFSDGKTACCNDASGLSVKDELIHHNSQICVSGLLHEYWTAQQVERVFKNCVHMNLGTAALHMAYITAGKYSAGIFLRTKLWDVAGGAAMLQAAGGVLKDFSGDDIFPFDCANYTGKVVQCLLGNQNIVNQIADMIK